MIRKIPDRELEILFLSVQGTFRRGATNDARLLRRGKSLPVLFVSVDSRVLSPLLFELIQRRRAHSPNVATISNTTKVLMAMKVGETIEHPPLSQSALTTFRATARRRLANSDARWHSETQPSGLLKITRLPDGASNIFGRPPNPLIERIAKLRVGENFTVSHQDHNVYASLKQRARIFLDNAKANWRYQTIPGGKTRITRIS